MSQPSCCHQLLLRCRRYVLLLPIRGTRYSARKRCGELIGSNLVLLGCAVAMLLLSAASNATRPLM